MRLDRFSAQRFRSITRAEKINLGDMTVLVGPNNEGKSNILQALVMGMEELSSSEEGSRRSSGLRRGPRRSSRGGGFRWSRDFPRSLQDAQPLGRSVLDFDFSLTQEEIDDFQADVGSKLNGVLPVRLEFGPRSVRFVVRKQRHSEALSKRRDQIAQFVAKRVQVQYVPAVRSGDMVEQIVREMVYRSLRAAESDPEYRDAVRRVEEVQQRTVREIEEGISSKLRDVLPDVREVRVDYSNRRVSAMGDTQITVDDGTATDLALKGDGVQSLAALAMIQHYSSETAEAKEFILCVEEPEAHLHPRAIHVLRGVLAETSRKQQVVLTTHSPLFVNRAEIASNVIVETNRAAAASSLSQLRETLGVRTQDNLEHAEVILVVEGQEDETAFRGLLCDASDHLSAAIEDGRLATYALHGGGNLNYALSLLRSTLAQVHVFVDDDQQGRQAAESAIAEGLTEVADLSFAVAQGANRGSEFEDLIRPEVYSEAFQTAFGVDILANPLVRRLGDGKWSDRMGRVFQAAGKTWGSARKGEAKAQVSAAIAASPRDALKENDAGVLASLVTSLERKLGAKG